jgi:hypothetical protein
MKVTIMVEDNGTTIIQTQGHAPIGKSHKSYEDGATVARLLADHLYDNGVDVNLIYNW